MWRARVLHISSFNHAGLTVCQAQKPQPTTTARSSTELGERRPPWTYTESTQRAGNVLIHRTSLQQVLKDAKDREVVHLTDFRE